MKKLTNFILDSYLKIIFIIITATSSFSSCEQFLDLNEPTNQISSNIIFSDKRLALAAISDLYANLRTNTLLNGGLYGSGSLLGCYTDELTSVTASSLDFKTFFDLGIVPTTPAIDNIWINAFKQIYAVNKIIEGLENSNAYIDEVSRKQMLGEALAIRGVLHFYLTNIYGAIPYITSTDYHQNRNASKFPTTEIYKKTQTDWETADNILVSEYPAADRTRINKSAVNLLLARLHLYQKNWAKAKDYAQVVIQNSMYNTENDISKVFLKDSKSTIWQFTSVDTGYNTMEGQYYIFIALPPSNVVLSDNLMNSFEASDLRKSMWTKTLSNATMSYTHPYKYKQNTKTSASLEYSVVLRVEEAYLILAESLNEMNDTAIALNYLNKIRIRAGLSPISIISQSQFRNELENERRHEFFTEFGHRFFDLKRWNRLDNVIHNLKPSWQSYMGILPIPQRELLANPLLNPQNNGY
ncbi:RagB/SusD family nutrient uptake outer membrane protein [Kaistella sp.]|uniref:RagB/SusD family nutrient uptake outer membrane protein n=1 Tax=Kaistella sp. TaxID=2782235 RepID=UPI003C4772F9